MPMVRPGFVAYIVAFLSIFLAATPALAKGLRTEELGNTEKDQIAQLAEEVRDNPNDGDITFRSSSKLIEINHVKAFGELKDLYDKGAEIVRAKIIKAIGIQREKGVIDAPTEYWSILEQALGSASKVLSDELVKSLSRLESEQFFTRLLDKIKAEDSSKTMIDSVVSVLCKFDDGNSNQTILSPTTIGVRVDAANLLGARGDAANVKCLIDSLSQKLAVDFTGPENLVEWWSQNDKKSVGKILDEANRRKDKRAARERLLSQKYRQKYVQERIENFKRALELDKAKGIALLLKELSDPEAELEAIVFAAGELGRLRVKDAVPPLMARLKSDSAGCRIAAIKALGEIGDTGALPEISKRVSSQRLDERLAAVAAVPKLGGEQSANVLIAGLKTEKDLSVQQEMVRGLGEVGFPVAIVPLVNLAAVVSQEKGVVLRDTLPNEFLIEVAKALGKILVSKHERQEAHRNLAIDFMLSMLAVNKDPVKFAAIQNLGDAGAEKAMSVLVDILNKDPNPGIRQAAARALGNMPKPDAASESALLANLEDKSSEVAGACMWSLRNIGGLNGSSRQVNLPLLFKWCAGLQSTKAHRHVRLLLKNLPEESDLKPADKEHKDILHELRGMLAEADVEVGDYKAALSELDKVVAYFKEPVEKVVKYRTMLARVYAALGQLTKAIDEYVRLIKIEPQKAENHWKEKLELIKKIGDDKEKLKRVTAALGLDPPQGVREQLENLKQELTAKLPKEPKTP